MTYVEAAAWPEPSPAIPPQMYNIMVNNEKVIKAIMQIARLDFEKTVKNFQNPEQLKILVDALIQRGFIDIPANKENLEKYSDNIGRAFDLGTTNYRPTTKPLLDTYKQVIQKNELNYIKNVSEKQKTEIGKVLTDAIQNRTMPSDIIKQLGDKAGLNESRASAITKTSMMRASNAASYAQNNIEGAKYFIVDHRSTACKYCIKAFHGRIFNINEAKYIPPIHTHCCCVPMFFNTREEAEAFAKDISKRNELELKELRKKGWKDIPDDGSGPNSNLKKLPEPTTVKPKGFNNELNSLPDLEVTLRTQNRNVHPTRRDENEVVLVNGAPSPELNNIRNLEDFINVHKEDVREWAAMFNSEGKIVYYAKGYEGKVFATDTNLARNAENVLYHNHPKGAPLSPGDLKTGLKHDAVAAFGKDYTYYFKIPESYTQTDKIRLFNKIDADYETEVKTLAIQESRNEFINKFNEENQHINGLEAYYSRETGKVEYTNYELHRELIDSYGLVKREILWENYHKYNTEFLNSIDNDLKYGRIQTNNWINSYKHILGA